MCAGRKRGLNLRLRASLLFSFPVFYAGCLFSIILLHDDPFEESPILSISCMVFAVLNIITSLLGHLGVYAKLDAALRSSLVLLIMENVIMFFISAFVLTESSKSFFLQKRHFHYYGRREPSDKLLFIAICLSCCVILFSFITAAMMGAVAEIQAELDAEIFVEEAGKLRDAERQQLLKQWEHFTPSPRTPIKPLTPSVANA